MDQPFSKVGSPWFWSSLRITRDFILNKKEQRKLSLSFELENLTNYQSAAIINGVTGKGYNFGDPLPLNFRDPIYPDPQDNGLPPTNPARWLQPRQMWLGLEFSF